MKKLIHDYVSRQQPAQTERRIRGRRSATLGYLENRLLSGDISEKRYKEMKAQYVEILFELYVKDVITYEQLQEKLNQ